MYQIERTENEVKLQSQSAVAIQKANELVVDAQDKLTLAADIIKFIKDKYKQAENERFAIVKPFNDGVKAINARFKTITDPLLKAESDLKQKMLTYQRQLERELREEEERKRKEVEQYAQDIAEKQKAEGDAAGAATLLNQLDKAMQKPVQIEKVRGSTGALSTIKKNWTYRVTDIVAFAKDRPDMVQVIPTEVRKLINAGARNVPGLEIYQEESLSIR